MTHISAKALHLVYRYHKAEHTHNSNLLLKKAKLSLNQVDASLSRRNDYKAAYELNTHFLIGLYKARFPLPHFSCRK